MAGKKNTKTGSGRAIEKVRVERWINRGRLRKRKYDIWSAIKTE